MTIKAKKFTPDVLISAPRRSAAVPHKDASFLLYTVSSYSFEKQKETNKLRLRDEKTGTDIALDQSGLANNAVWLDPENPNDRGGDILFLKAREGKDEKGVTDLICWQGLVEGDTYVVGTFNGPVDNLRVTKVGEEYYAIAVSGNANPDGTLYNPNTASSPKTSAKLYKSLFVRHWDSYVTPQRQSIFYAALLPRTEGTSPRNLFMSNLVNPLKGTGLESPMPPFGGTDHFDISRKGVVFVAKDPDLSPALHTKCNIYVVPLSNFMETTPEIFTVDMGEYKGAMTSPKFSHDASKIAFLAMREDGYEADRNEIFVMPDITRPAWLKHYRASKEAKSNWDRSPESVHWSNDDTSLWLIADNWSVKQIFKMPLDPEDTKTLSVYPLTGSVSSLHALPNGKLFASSSSFIDSSIWWYFDPAETDHFDRTPTAPWLPYPNLPGYTRGQRLEPLSSLSEDGRLFNLGPHQISHGTVASDTSPAGFVHMWVLKPSDFDDTKKYPIAILVHGGPQSSWENAWSTRWNPAVFAEQGYVVVTPNPTGSTGYGQACTDGIQGEWGGRPYENLVEVFGLAKTIPFMDTERAVLLGASYGGFMANWVQGSPLGRELKAIVCHDGVFSISYELATDELYFVNREFKGPWNPKNGKTLEEWRKWDPSLRTDNWSTPQLIIHSEKDYRLNMSDGLAAFNILQSKGIESEFLTFNDETHFVLGKENSLRWHEVVISFINQHVGLPPWERSKGDLDDIRMDPDVSVKGNDEGRSRVRVVGEGERVEARIGK